MCPQRCSKASLWRIITRCANGDGAGGFDGIPHKLLFKAGDDDGVLPL